MDYIYQRFSSKVWKRNILLDFSMIKRYMKVLGLWKTDGLTDGANGLMKAFKDWY